MPRITKIYTEKFKQEAIKLALSSSSIKSVAQSLGIADSTLHTWVKKVKEDSKEQVITSAEELFNKVKLTADNKD